MSQERNLREAGRRLASDLKDLRENRHVDVDVLLRTIRLSPDILEKFDESALIDHPAFNRVYLRSIVTSYATVLGIDVDLARLSLEQALRGQYKNQLRKKYLSGAVTLADAFVSVDEGDEPIVVIGLSADAGKNTDSDHRQAERLLELGGRYTRSITKPQKKRYRFPKVFLSVLGLAVLGWVVSRFFPDLTRSEPVDVTESTFETDRPVLPGRETTVKYKAVILPDSMVFQVIALYAPVDPIRVTRDQWARRPYWIEFGDTLTFRAAETIIFESDIESALIELEGYALSDSLIDSKGRIELSRERAQRWLDLLIANNNRAR